MSIADKAKAAADQAIGTAKEKFGDATDNEQLQAEGAVQHAKGDMEAKGEQAKDAAKDALDGLKKKID